MIRGGGLASTISSGDRSNHERTALATLTALLVVVAILSIGIGPSGLSPTRVVGLLVAGPAGSGYPVSESIIVWQIRLPRVLMGSIIGASLAVAGAVMQGLFRNPLADPGIVGVSPGAALAAVTVIVLGTGPLAFVVQPLGIFALPLGAFLGGLLSTSLLYVIATRGGRTSVATLLLAGIALGAFSGAITGFFLFLSDDDQLRDITFWSLGGLGGTTWIKLLACGPIMLAVLVAAPVLSRGLNALTLGESEAFYLGVDIETLKKLAIVLVAAATGASVAAAGIIGFVGIVVPHLLRLAVGADHRFLLPACGLLGGSLLVLADALARTVAAPAELPIGIITAAIGAPFFLWLLLKRRGLLGV